MKRHLQYTCEDYIQEADGRGVRPISHMDGEIITELIAIIARENEQLSQILDQWKHIDDEKVLKLLQDFKSGKGVDVDQYDDEEDIEVNPLDFIKIKDTMFRAVFLISIEKYETYKGNSIKYGIWLNKGPLPPKDAYYEDTQILYGSKEKRDEELNILKGKLRRYGIKFI